MTEPVETEPTEPGPAGPGRPGTLARLSAALRGTPAEQLAGMRLALRLAFLVLALPGLPLGLLYLLTRPAPLSLPVTAALVGTALVLGLGTLWLARRAAVNPDIPREQRGLSAAIQGASAPAVAFLLGCASLSSWPALLLLWGMAAAFYFFVWQQLPVWAAQTRD